MSAGQLRTIKKRIRSVENTQKITRAMELVSAAKLKRFQNLLEKAKPFSDELEKLAGTLSRAGGDAYRHPFFTPREEARSAYVVITSDTGLCGTYNAELVQRALKVLVQTAPVPIVFGIGKRGIRALAQAGFDCERKFQDLKVADLENTIRDLGQILADGFLNNRFDAVRFVHGSFRHGGRPRPEITQILPCAAPDEGPDIRYIFEPSRREVFDSLAPLFLASRVRAVLLEAFVAEQMERMNAMHQATKNAREMIDALVLLRNKMRQAIITKEIIEIVSGSKALEG
ncbi:MAG: ATP synthase F1 subunit gamma [Candidatus Omnitrophota bacterium]